MKIRKLGITLITIFLSFAIAAPSWAGRIFITGHDPIWHSLNSQSAKNLASTGIEYARGGSTQKFLFIESITATIPTGNRRTAPDLVSSLGYAASDFDVIDGAGLGALVDFRGFLNSYSAIVVASDHGGMLTSSELTFLNNNSSSIFDYINSGGGLYAESESNATGLIGNTQRFGFLPFLVSSTDFNVPETSNTVTAFGASLGLTDSDVNGNFSHNYFSNTGGMNVVDNFNGDPSRPLTLAFDGTLTTQGVPAPFSLGIFSLGFILLGMGKFR